MDDATGFRRIEAYRNAARPADVAAWAGVPLKAGGTVPCPDSGQGSGRVADALAELDAIAIEGRWTDRSSLGAVVDPHLAEVLGLDLSDPQLGLRAAVARAYAAADKVADAFARRQQDLSDAAEMAHRINQGLDMIAGRELGLWHNDGEGGAIPLESTRTGARVPDWFGEEAEARERLSPHDHGGEPEAVWNFESDLTRALSILERWRFDRPGEAEQRRETIIAGLATLSTVVRMLHGIHTLQPERGRRPETPRMFLLVRLAEIYALLCGEAPIFSYSERIGSNQGPAGRWHRFLVAALGAIAWPRGLQGLDGALRSIPEEEPGAATQIADLAVHSRWLRSAEAWAPAVQERRRAIQLGALQSNGLMIDLKLPMPWED